MISEQMIKEELKDLDYNESVTIDLANGLEVVVKLVPDKYFNFESADTLQHCRLDYEFAKGDLVGYVGVVATLYYEGREVGEDSVWGMEYCFTSEIAGITLSNDHLPEAAWECIQEVLAHAGEYDKIASAVKELSAYDTPDNWVSRWNSFNKFNQQSK